jgi:lysyl-tRNA synthetase, class I
MEPVVESLDDWVSRFADEVIALARGDRAAIPAGRADVAALAPGDRATIPAGRADVAAEAARRAPDKPIVVASGLSPSGPIHLGNLREVMTPHLVADEIRRRGHEVVHVLSWDDFDRFRKVPAGIDPAWAEHIGKPLSRVPAPPGSTYPNWAEHFKAPMIDAMARLGIEVRPISQTSMYTSGAYRDQVLHAMGERGKIDAILGRYRTKKIVVSEDADEVAAAEGSGAAAEDDGGSERGYYPFKPYCSNCDKDLTVVTDYDDATTALAYECTACGHTETVFLNEFTNGKLVWKVDWPMRWAYEGVDFEPSGVDHSSPGSSFVVGGFIVRDVFGAEPPIGPMYAFVGISGMAKMSSSKGGVPTAADALEIMEPALLRWLYARRRPNQSFKVAFDQEIQRLYDEWDSLAARVASGAANPADTASYQRAIRTESAGVLPQTPRPLPYRTLASIVDITTGHEEQTLRILRDLDPSDPITSLDEARPRLDCAERWITTQVPAEQRTRVREEPDTELLASLDATQLESLRLLREGLDSHWSLDGLTALVYGVPKQMAGLPMDTKPTPELKVAQREFFALIYHLLVARDTGPRLPTLLLTIGADKVRILLGG